jgi:hypothetical protein
VLNLMPVQAIRPGRAKAAEQASWMIVVAAETLAARRTMPYLERAVAFSAISPANTLAAPNPGNGTFPNSGNAVKLIALEVSPS